MFAFLERAAGKALFGDVLDQHDDAADLAVGIALRDIFGLDEQGAARRMREFGDEPLRFSGQGGSEKRSAMLENLVAQHFAHGPAENLAPGALEPVDQPAIDEAIA